MALDVMRVVYETGLEVPGDTNIVGFDDIPKASYYAPPLTTPSARNLSRSDVEHGDAPAPASRGA
jgi:hypothetical protein